jgi:hypothetical protein
MCFGRNCFSHRGSSQRGSLDNRIGLSDEDATSQTNFASETEDVASQTDWTTVTVDAASQTDLTAELFP